MIGSKYLAKVAEDKESKKIDALSALTTAGGGVAGALMGSSVGEEFGSRLPYMSRPKALTHLEGDQLAKAVAKMDRRAVRPSDIGLTGDANIKRLARKQFMKYPEVQQLLKMRHDGRAELKKITKAVKESTDWAAQMQQKLNRAAEDVVQGGVWGTKLSDKTLLDSIRGRKRLLDQAINNNLENREARANLKETLSDVLSRTRGRARDIYDKKLTTLGEKAANKYRVAFDKGLDKASVRAGKIGKVVGGGLGSIALSSLMYGLTNPKTREKFSKLTDK